MNPPADPCEVEVVRRSPGHVAVKCLRLQAGKTKNRDFSRFFKLVPVEGLESKKCFVINGLQ
jgi:hypothetical protein